MKIFIHQVIEVTLKWIEIHAINLIFTLSKNPTHPYPQTYNETIIRPISAAASIASTQSSALQSKYNRAQAPAELEQCINPLLTYIYLYTYYPTSCRHVLKTVQLQEIKGLPVAIAANADFS